MNNQWRDVHGAGAQRSDPKSGDPNDYPTGHGPQGDAIRIYNYVRLVRDADVVSVETGSLEVTLSPSDAVSAGAQWQVDSGSWQSSGATVSDLSAGTHTVRFKTIDGRTAPSDQTVAISAGVTEAVSGTYTLQETYNLADAIVILRILCGITPQNSEGYKDTNGDRKAGMEDAVFILQSSLLFNPDIVFEMEHLGFATGKKECEKTYRLMRYLCQSLIPIPAAFSII